MAGLVALLCLVLPHLQSRRAEEGFSQADQTTYSTGVAPPGATVITSMESGIMSLEFETARIEPDITVVSLYGRLVAGPEAQVLEGLVQDLVGGGERKLILDLCGIVKIDSAGVQFLLQSFFTMRQAQGVLRLANAPPKVARLFSKTRLDAILPTYVSVPAASVGFDRKTGA